MRRVSVATARGTPMTDGRTVGGEATTEAWAVVRTFLDDMAAMVAKESETELELIEGYRGPRAHHRTGRRGLPRRGPGAPVVLPDELARPDGRRPESRRRLPPGHDRRGHALPGDGRPQLGHVPRIPGARRTRPDPAPHGRLRLGHRPGARRRRPLRTGAGEPTSRTRRSSTVPPGCRFPRTPPPSWCASTSATGRPRPRRSSPSRRSTRPDCRTFPPTPGSPSR